MDWDALTIASNTQNNQTRARSRSSSRPAAMARSSDDNHADDASGPFDPRLFAKLVYLCVRQVPKGKVTTYGQIARLCHHPKHSRHVGKALRALPDDTDVPWQRVINASSTISPRGDGGLSARRQAERLREEGVQVTQDAMGSWRVPASAWWDAGGAHTLEQVLSKRRRREDGPGEEEKSRKKRRRREREMGARTAAADDDVVVKEEEEGEEEDN